MSSSQREEGACGWEPTSPARSTSPILSSLCSQEATVGNTILDKVDVLLSLIACFLTSHWLWYRYELDNT